MPNSLLYLYNRLCHFILAKPIDILHSPFVFKFYQDAAALKRNHQINHNFIALFQKTACSQPNAIAALLTALNVKHLFQLNCNQETWYLTNLNQPSIQHTMEEMVQYQVQVVAICIESSQLNNLPLVALKMLLNSDCPLLVNTPHANADSSKKWYELYQQNEIQIAVDFFDFGLCFFNRKQAKEYFKLRLW